MNDIEKERLELLARKELKENFDLLDFSSVIDSTLTYGENETLLYSAMEYMQENTFQFENMKEMQITAKLEHGKHNNNFNIFWKICPKIKIMVVLGDTGSGKTAFCFKLLQNFQHKEIYIYKHPDSKLIMQLGYKNMQSLSELSHIKDAVVYFDEPNIHFQKYEKRTNELFMQLCAMARQKDIALIFSTSDTRWVNKGLESYVSHWIIKNLDMNLIKQGCIAKKIIREVMPLATDDLILAINQYILYTRTEPNINKLYSFIKPVYYDDRFSKAYKNI